MGLYLWMSVCARVCVNGSTCTGLFIRSRPLTRLQTSFSHWASNMWRTCWLTSSSCSWLLWTWRCSFLQWGLLIEQVYFSWNVFHLWESTFPFNCITVEWKSRNSSSTGVLLCRTWTGKCAEFWKRITGFMFEDPLMHNKTTLYCAGNI